ncbi:MAG: sulfite exporter TauE/SafE family protein [Roseibium sp.]|nr:sulfite exporter TauE/SafE family protein [Roseibium sp.]
MAAIEILAFAGVVFVLAGIVKGVTGFGLPTLALGLLTLVTGHEAAMTLILVPSFVTNLWQATTGGQLLALLRRLWPFLFTATVCVWIGTSVLTELPAGTADTLLGALLILYAVPGLFGMHVRIGSRRETVTGAAAGILNGVLTGLTGSFTVPGVFFLQSIGLGRDQLVQGMGLLFLASTLALAVSLSGHGLLAGTQTVTSAAMVIPALAGVWLGSRIRRKLTDRGFRTVVLVVLFSLGAYLLIAGLLNL